MLNKKGFTLTEAQLTLMMIGIIAAMTIPILTSDVGQRKHITMFKKLYSSFNVNIQTVLGEKNCDFLSCLRAWGEENPTKHNGALADPNYLDIDYICTDCFKRASSKVNVYLPPPMQAMQDEETETVKDETTGEYVTKTTQEKTDANFTAYRLKNSAVIGIYDFEGNCSTTLDNVTNNGTAVDLCGIIIFDLNGVNGPNQPGEDRYAFYISDEIIDGSHLIPIGYSEADKNNNTQFNKNGAITSTIGEGVCTPGKLDGYNCTAKIMTSGWKMGF